MFEYKSQEELAKMSAEELKQYHAEMKAHEKKELENEIKTAVEPVNKSIEEIQKSIKTSQDAANKSITDLADSVNAFGEQLKGFGTPEGEADVRAKVLKWVTDNHEMIVDKMKSGGNIDISKAVGNMTTASGTMDPLLPANYIVERRGVPNVRLRRPYLFDVVNTFNTSEKTLPYVEAIPKEGDFAVVPEGTVKPQLDFTWETRYVTPTKFAGYIHVTDELLYDIPRITDTIVNYLRDKHDIFKDNKIFEYINTTAIAFAAGALANSVSMPNIIDVVNAMQVQILNSPNYVDEPDFYADTVLMNSVDFFKHFSSVKDALGRNLYSDVMLLSGSMIYNGIKFISTKQVPAGQIILFDSSKIDVSNYEGYNVKMGWINDDFIKNMRVILGESRGHIYIKNHDKRAFVKGSIDTIITALTKPPVTP